MTPTVNLRSGILPPISRDEPSETNSDGNSNNNNNNNNSNNNGFYIHVHSSLLY